MEIRGGKIPNLLIAPKKNVWMSAPIHVHVIVTCSTVQNDFDYHLFYQFIRTGVRIKHTLLYMKSDYF